MSIKEKLMSILPLIYVSMIILGIVFVVLFAIYNNCFMAYLSIWIMFLAAELVIIDYVHDLANDMHSSDIKKQLAARVATEGWSSISAIILLTGLVVNFLCLLLLFSKIGVDIERSIAGLLFFIAFFMAMVVESYAISIRQNPEKPENPEKATNAAS